MSDNEDVKLPIPSRTTGVYAGGVSSLRSGRGGTAGAAGRSSRKVVEGLRTASSRRLNYSSFTSNGSNKGLNGDNTEGSATGSVAGPGRGGGTQSKSCSACGIQFTWRMRRHHCRGCKKAVCDPCSKERLQIVGGDNKRHRVCHPCVKQHLASGRTRENRLVPPPSVAPSSLRSSPFESRDTSRNVSRDASRHGPGKSSKGLATYAEHQEPRQPRPAAAAAAAVAAAGQEETKYSGEDGGAAAAAASAAPTAAAMAAAWAGSDAHAAAASGGTANAGVGTQAAATATATAAPTEESFGAPSASVSDLSPAAHQQHQQQRQQQLREAASNLQAAQAAATTSTATVTLAPELVVASEETPPAAGAEVAVATVVGVAVAAAATAGEAGRGTRPPLGTGVKADPTSHQHKRPVQSAKDQNPLALPWFSGKHSSPCSICEDLWKVAWSAREDFLRDLKKSEGEKGYQLVASSGDNLRLYAAANMFWGGQAIRLRVEMEVAVPLGFAMRWLASLTARGGVYYPYSETTQCDTVESDKGALSVACAHWPTNLSGARRCALLRYVSEDGSPPPGLENDPSVAGKTRDMRPTIVFTTIEHPIMREWAQPGVDVEVFPSGLVLEQMESPAGAVTKVHGLIGWDNKGTVQHMAKMSYMTERADRLEGLDQHLRAMERGYLEEQKSGEDPVLGPTKPSPPEQQRHTSTKNGNSRPPSTPGTSSRRRAAGAGGSAGGKASAKRGKGGGEGGGIPSASPGSPPTDFSPLPPKNVLDKSTANLAAAAAAAAAEDDEVDSTRKRMTSRAGPLSPNRGRDLSGGAEAVGTPGVHNRDGQAIRRNSTGVGGVGDWTPPPGHKTIPSPARAAELEAEVAFLNRQLSVRQSLEERLRASESDKARLITKLATAQADAARRAESLEAMLREMGGKLKIAEEQVAATRKQLGDAEERAMVAQRDLRLSREALRVQSEMFGGNTAAAAGPGSATLGSGSEAGGGSGGPPVLSLSPAGKGSSRFPISNYDLPLAASPALRAPPPVRWGSGPVGPGGGGGSDGGDGGGGVKGNEGGGEGGDDEKAEAAGSGGRGRGQLLVGRTQEMGVRFALDTLRYSEDEEVVVFMLHLVQGLRHEALGPGTPRGRSSSTHSGRGGAPSGGPSVNPSTLARVLFKPNPVTSSSSGKAQGGKGGANGGGLSQLALLLIGRACDNEEVANFLFWYLKLEAEGDATLRPMYEGVRKALMESLAKQNAPFEAALRAAEAYMASISEVHGIVKKRGGRAPAKTARLKAALADKRLHVVPNLGGAGGKHGGKGKGGIGGKGKKAAAAAAAAAAVAAVIPLPLDPHTSVVGLRPATAYTFPSAMSPCVVEFVLSESVGPSFERDDLLLEPDEDGPRMVTDISAADLRSWSGAGPLPRARSQSVGSRSAAKMTHVVESAVRVEPWEEEEEAAAPTEDSLAPRTSSADVLDVDDEDETFLDRRRISADAGSYMDYDDPNADTFSVVKRRRDLSESVVTDDVGEINAKVNPKGTKATSPANKNEEDISSKSKDRDAGAPGGAGAGSLNLARQASGNLTKLRLWEQMQVLGAASRERGSYLAIFKNGEDVRQDQLAVHMVSLMDRQLKEAGLDLRLKSYRVLATSLTTGMIEFVPGSVPMSAVLAKHNNSVLEFLRHHNADPGGPLGMKREALDNFTRSCAGSCVVTYLLGVGDRHLDNLMLLPEGVLFHIDFGYLFGKDPKLMPPPFRLTKEMVEAMGGTEAPHYTVFKSLCCQAYRHLRKSAHQYLNLLSLMSGAGIKDLADDPAAVLQLVQDRFKLDLTDEQADAHFLALVSQSATALAPRVLEVMHQIRVAAR